MTMPFRKLSLKSVRIDSTVAIPCGACIAMLLLALGRMPYAYYQFLRWVVCVSAVWLCVNSAKSKVPWLAFVFALVAVFYNPITPFAMKRRSWEVVNVMTLVILLLGFAILTLLDYRTATQDRLGKDAQPQGAPSQETDKSNSQD